MDNIMLDISGSKELSNGIISINRAKAYQMAICILSMLATTDSALSKSAFSDLIEEDDDVLPPMP